MPYYLKSLVILTTFLAALAQPPVACGAEGPSADKTALRQQRLELLESQVNKLQIEIAGRELRRSEQPILRWSNPVREFVNDGITFLFCEGKRPRAVATAWARSEDAHLERGELWREFVSLCGEPLHCTRNGQKLWAPPAGGFAEQTLAEAPSAAKTPARRLLEMRELARRFEAATYKTDDVPSPLRLMPQPLYRYQDEAAGIVDGALFAFSEANDAEALLLLEALGGTGGNRQAWQYIVARMTSYPLIMRLDGQEIFKVESYWKGPRSPENPYVEARDGPFRLNDDAGQDAGAERP